MTEIAEVAGDIGEWLPRVSVLIAEPDTDGSTGAGGKPGSRPPWNPSAAAAFFDSLAVIRDVLGTFQIIVYGHTGEPISWSDGSTQRALKTIVNLSHAVPHLYVKRAARDLGHCLTVFLQLAAIDEVETPRMLPAKCSYCGGEMLWFYPREGKVTCLYSLGDDGRFKPCRDLNGDRPIGFTGYDHLGNPAILWLDGTVT